jgi:signal transduction histidine kinase
MCAENASAERDDGMDSRNPEEIPAETCEELIAPRLRSASLVLAAAVALIAALDLALCPGRVVPVVWIYGADLILVLLVQLASRHPRTRVHILPVAALAVVLWNALFCGYAALSPRGISVLIAPSIAITTAAALLFPWGLRLQSIVGGACVLTCAGAFVLAGRYADLDAVYALASLLGAAAVSCIGAHLVDRRARLVDEQTAGLRERNRLMQEAAVRKDEFLASVSHELRTPVNVVLGYVDLLLDHSFGTLEPAQRDVLHRIARNATNLSTLINDLIDLSRIDAGRLKVQIGTVELAPLFTDLSGVMEVLLAGHDVKFTSTIVPSCPKVSADPERLKQIVTNLLVNAVKFTEHGSITLRAEPGSDGSVALVVADTGIGIPRTAQRAIFEPFCQVHDRRLRVPGAGIGLSISSRLAHLMGGSLTVESTPGLGSRFTLVVPAVPEPPRAPAVVPNALRGVS